MNREKPSELTEPQWLLLRYLNKYSSSFYIEPLYEQFSLHQIDRLHFYKLFFQLVGLNYVQPDGYHAKVVSGHKYDFRYALTRKGKRAITQHTRTVEAINFPVRRPHPYQRHKQTIVLADYSFNS